MTQQTQDTRLKARGQGEKQRVLWMATFAPGVRGRRGLPYVLVGEPGSAKTSTLEQLSYQAGLHFEAVLGSLRSPMDFLGVPVPRRMPLTPANQHLSPDGEPEFTYMHYAPAGFSVRAAERKNCVVLFDEVNTCQPSVQAALLRVLFEGVVGELPLPPGVRIFLAMNETRDAAGGWDIAPPLQNRVGWLDWDRPTPQGFAQYIASGGRATADPVDPAAEEAAVDAAWSGAFSRAAGDVAGFLSKRGDDLLLKRPSEGSRDRAWPSPRTWELATRALAGSYVYDLTESERAIAASGFVGSAAYGEFFTWKKEADLPDPEDVLSGKVQFKHNKARIDRTAAVLTACSSLMVQSADQRRRSAGYEDRLTRMWQLCHLVTKDSVDIALPSIQALNDCRLAIGNQAAFKVLADIDPQMQAGDLKRV